MKIELNTHLADLDGKPIQNIANETNGKVLANALASSAEGDPVKFMSWAILFHAGQPIEIHKSDFETIRTFVESSRSLTNLAKAAIINSMIEQRDKQDAKKV